MEVGHDEEAEGDGDDAEEFDVVVGADTVSEVLCDLAVKDDASAASGKNEEANDESAKIE